MWNESYVTCLKNFEVKIDNYIITDIKFDNILDYEFKAKISTDYNKFESYDTKNMLISAYNLGKLIDEKFSYNGYLPDLKDINNYDNVTIIRRNIFLKARYETKLQYQAQLKKFYEEMNKKINKSKSVKMSDIDKENKYQRFEKNIEKKIYKNKINELFIKYNIQEKDSKDLIKCINKFIQVCGIPIVNESMKIYNQDLFSIIFLAHKIYLFIKNEGKYHLEVNQTQTMKDNGELKLEFNTVNDLLYSLAINYLVFNRNGYIICSQCGKMAPGNNKRKTCSERCKKIRNGSYFRKK